MIHAPDIVCWLVDLARTNTKRKAIVLELLRYAGEDKMTAEDRTVCRRGLVLLSLAVVPKRKVVAVGEPWISGLFQLGFPIQGGLND